MTTIDITWCTEHDGIIDVDQDICDIARAGEIGDCIEEALMLRSEAPTGGAISAFLAGMDPEARLYALAIAVIGPFLGLALCIEAITAWS